MRDETIFPDFEEKIANNFETICTFSDAERNLSIWRTLYIMQYLQGKREKEREVSEDGGDRSRRENTNTKSNTMGENQERISLVREREENFSSTTFFISSMEKEKFV